MSTNSKIEFRRHAVPVVVFAIVAVAALVVPPLVLGELSGKTYAIAAAIVILAIGHVTPYAALVAIGTLPLLYTGIASYAAPQEPPGDAYSFSAAAALRHIAAGFLYTLAAAAVGAIGYGATFTLSNIPTWLAAWLAQLLIVGGLLIPAAYVALQLWRHKEVAGSLDKQTIIGTTILGVLLALSPRVALWMFDGTMG